MNTFQFKITKKQFMISLIGNIILGIGIAVLRVSSMGNDPYTAMNMSISNLLPIGLGTYQVIFNCSIIAIQLKFGKNYFGIGTVINMFLLGYIVEYSIPVIELLVGVEGSHGFIGKLLIMLVAVLLVAFGIAVYQEANGGVSPYDYLSLGMTDRGKFPYFVNRMTTDGICVIIALLPWIFGAAIFSECHIGIGTIVSAFCFGPLVDLFSRTVVRKIIK
ncbi:MAG: hypothetical protein R3Y24_08855 [Eubacteriales bacterium]